MKAEVRVTPDGGLMIYIPPEQLTEEAYDIPRGLCGCAKLPEHPLMPSLLGAPLRIKPMPPVTLLDECGSLGLPARIESMIKEMDELVDNLIPKTLMFQLLPEKKSTPLSLVKALLPAGLEIPKVTAKHSSKKFMFANVNGKKVFIGFINDNGKGQLTIKGPDAKADQYVGTANMSGNVIKISVEGLNDPEKVLQKLSGLTDIELTKVNGK